MTRRLTFTAVALLVCFTKSDLTAAEQSASVTQDDMQEHIAELLACVPTFDVNDKSLKSFEFTLQLVYPARPTRIHYGWDRQAGSALLCTTPDGRTPLVWAAEGQMLVCDIAQPELTAVKGIHANMDLKGIDDNRLRFNVSFNSKVHAPAIDLRSLLPAPDAAWSIERKGRDMSLSQSSRTGNSVLKVHYVIDDQPRMIGLESRSTTDPESVLISVESIQINRPFSSVLRSFPEKPLQAADVPVRSLPINGPLDVGQMMLHINRALLMPALLDEPPLRQHPSLRLLTQDLNWDEIIERRSDLYPKLQRSLTDSR